MLARHSPPLNAAVLTGFTGCQVAGFGVPGSGHILESQGVAGQASQGNVRRRKGSPPFGGI